MNKRIALLWTVGLAHLKGGAWPLGAVYEFRVHWKRSPAGFVFVGTRRRDLRAP